MSGHSVVYLMYHELEIPGRPLCQPDRGYVRYVLRQDEFQEQVDHLKAAGYRGLSVGQALSSPSDKSVVITFDDGSETDLIAAAPILRNAGFGATFFLTVAWLGKPGYLSEAQVRELATQGFEIGCHSLTHAYLSDLDENGLKREIADARVQLEKITGAPVHHFSCPGGRYNDRAVRVAREAGYKTVTTSEIQANSAGTDPFALGRIAITRGLPMKTFADICSGEALPRMRRQSSLRNGAKKLLGNSLYDRVRGVLLGSHDSAS